MRTRLCDLEMKDGYKRVLAYLGTERDFFEIEDKFSRPNTQLNDPKCPLNTIRSPEKIKGQEIQAILIELVNDGFVLVRRGSQINFYKINEDALIL